MKIIKGLNKDLDITEFTYSTGIRAKRLERGLDVKSFIKIFYIGEHVANYDFDKNSDRDILTIIVDKQHIVDLLTEKDHIKTLRELSA